MNVMLNEIIQNFNYAKGNYANKNSTILNVCHSKFGHKHIMPKNIYVKYFLCLINDRLKKFLRSQLSQIGFGVSSFYQIDRTHCVLVFSKKLSQRL